MSGMRIQLRVGDISPEFDAAMRVEGVSAWDIETDGLDFRSDAIRTCQVFVPGHGIEVVRIADTVPERLIDALTSERVTKVFHHAPFDLRFMRRWWDVRPRRVACTKVMSKIVFPERDNHSLAALVQDQLGITLDKSQRLSDWGAADLSAEQLAYAANDVVHLLELSRMLWKEALNIGVGNLVEQSFAYLPVRVETDFWGAGDVFAY